MTQLRHLPKWVAGHDTFVFVFGRTLVPRQLDVALLHRLRKEVLFVFLGSDIRHWEATEQYRAEMGLASYEGYRERAPDLGMRALRLAEVHGAVSFLQPSYAEAALGPYMHAYLALDPHEYEFHVPDNDVPIVVHAPSKRSLKGTEEILRSLDELRRDGVRFELQLLENLPNQEVRKVLRDADVVVDELREAHYGMLGLEAIASGCAVLAGNRPDIVPYPASRPVVHLSPTNLAPELRSVLTDRKRRREIAQSGRGFVDAHHDRVAVSQRILDDLARAQRGDFDYRPSFFAERYEPSLLRASRTERRLTRRAVERWQLGDELRESLRRRRLSL